MGRVCIICHQEKFGDAVEDTRVIRAIRTLKSKLRMQTGNTLVVCQNCTLAHAKKRKSFEARWMQHAVLGIAIFLLLVGLPLLSLQFSLGTTFLAALLSAGIVSLSLIDYTPPLANTSISASALEREQKSPSPAGAHPASQPSGQFALGRLMAPSGSRPIIIMPDKTRPPQKHGAKKATASAAGRKKR